MMFLYSESFRLSRSAWTLKTDEAVPTPINFQRIDGSIGRTGYLSLHSQHHQGDPGKRKGTFRLAFTDDSGEGKSVASSEAWEYLAGEWHSVAMVFNQGKVRFYLNGEQVGEPVDAPVTTLPAVQSTRAGIRVGRGFAGEIDDLIILPDRALDDQRIKALHQEGTKSESVRAILNQ